MKEEIKNELRNELKEEVKNIINETKEEVDNGINNMKENFKNLEQFEDVKYFSILEFVFNNIVGVVGGFVLLSLIGGFVLDKISILEPIVNPFLVFYSIGMMVMCVVNITKFIFNYKYIKQLRKKEEMLKGKLFVLFRNVLSLTITIIILLFAAKDEIMMNIEYELNKAFDEGATRALQEQGINYVPNELTYDEFKELKYESNVNSNVSLIYGEWQETVNGYNLVIVEDMYNSCPYEIIDEKYNLYTLLIHTYEGDAKVNVEYDNLNDSITVSYYDEETDSYFGYDTYYRKY